ncbi:MAG TPA: ABC transporter substrate-binding protein [Nitrobacter sp.]|nr:ABC transporter substrate-binding protein [Nitrobacter sp.]
MAGWRKTIVAAALLAALPLAVGQAAAQDGLKHIKMLYTAVNGFATAYVAQEQGMFKKRGLDVEFVLTASSGNNPPALVSGSVQIAGPTIPTLLAANDAGLDLVVFGSGGVYPLQGDVLVARYGSGIKSPKDLKGKTVGVPGLGALLDFMLRRNLKANGVDPSTVKFVEVGFVQAGDALKSGRIDAYPAQLPFTTRIIQSKQGYEVANWLKDTPDGTLTVVYAATRKWAEANRDTIAKIRSALKEANDYIKAGHPDEVAAAVAKYTHLPAKIVAMVPLPNMQVEVTAKQIQFWIDLMKQEKAIKGSPDAQKILFEP